METGVVDGVKAGGASLVGDALTPGARGTAVGRERVTVGATVGVAMLAIVFVGVAVVVVDFVRGAIMAVVIVGVAASTKISVGKKA